MKRVTIAALAAVLMLNTIPAFAQETPQDKYICELQAGNCKNRADAIQRKMKKINADIKKGNKTYSAEDLKKIEDKLKEAEQMLDNLKAQQPH
ncbi:hypothetical protein [Geomonas sp.]|uniref:hypothetical protein n=1 Tax=Geomonas sp. TaxID=2651584 RepID=UPI002B477AF1|nr:hypothetical protein [Geomonas sp.]HJV36469.1 hypothetical protein [Geomonas sp.]